MLGFEIGKASYCLLVSDSLTEIITRVRGALQHQHASLFVLLHRLLQLLLLSFFVLLLDDLLDKVGVRDDLG